MGIAMTHAETFNSTVRRNRVEKLWRDGNPKIQIELIGVSGSILGCFRHQQARAALDFFIECERDYEQAVIDFQI